MDLWMDEVGGLGVGGVAEVLRAEEVECLFARTWKSEFFMSHRVFWGCSLIHTFYFLARLYQRMQD